MVKVKNNLINVNNAKLSFETLKFCKVEDKIRAVLLKYFYFDFESSDLGLSLDKIEIKDEDIFVDLVDISQTRLENKFNNVMRVGLNNLISLISGKHTVYIHKNSGIPLIGSNVVGIVDRNTSLIEIKPVTGCNLNCIFCSVDEGKSSKKVVDFVVEKDYLVGEVQKLIEKKDNENIEINIGTHGEPLLYADLVSLITDLKAIKEVKRISINTNGTFLTKKLVDQLGWAGLDQINLSLDAMNQEVAFKLAGASPFIQKGVIVNNHEKNNLNNKNNVIYNLVHVKKMAKYIVTKLDLLIAPVWVPTYNDNEIVKLIKFAKGIGAKIAIQNFLNYKKGRNPVKQQAWIPFYEKLKSYEKEFGVKLVYNSNDFNIEQTKKLNNPFKKNEFVKLKLVVPGRYSNEKLAIERERLITVITDKKVGLEIKVKIVRIKHNIIVGIESSN